MNLASRRRIEAEGTFPQTLVSVVKPRLLAMRGYIDLHCHPLPGIDDGVKTADDGTALLAGLHRIGFDHVIATPHIRSGVWNNARESIDAAHRDLETCLARARTDGVAIPSVRIAAEHMFDDVGWELFVQKRAMLYPGDRAALVEFAYDNIPVRVEVRLWRLKKSGVTPVLAHPERYAPLYRDSERLEELIGAGARPLLDVMSLVGVYGRQPQVAAARMLSEGRYAAACSDSHKPSDVEIVADAVAKLAQTVGAQEFQRLMVQGPASLLEGRDN